MVQLTCSPVHNSIPLSMRLGFRVGWGGAARLLGRLRQIVGPDALIANEDELLVYECDGYVVEKRVPDVVVFPASRQQVVDIVCACNEYDVPFVPRRASTSRNALVSRCTGR